MIHGDLRAAPGQLEISIGEGGGLEASLAEADHELLVCVRVDIRDPLETLRGLLKVGFHPVVLIENCILGGELVGGSQLIPRGRDLAQVLGEVRCLVAQLS